MDTVSLTLSDKQETRRQLHYTVLSLLSVLVGVVSGIGAAGFRALISFFHNMLFLGKLSVTYEANVHTPPSPWGPLVILVPVVGSLGVSFLVTRFAPEAKGHGVPEVMDSIYYNRGIIRPVVALVKSFASALSIGSGGSVGREGPIIQIGSSFGSTLGQIISMPTWQRVTLIAAGTGAGIAATFNTPIGGMLFAMEIMLHEVSVRTLVPVGIATATATYIGQMFFGVYPAFVIPELQTFTFQPNNPLVLVCYVGLGLIIGMVSALYIRSIYFFEDFFSSRIKANDFVRHMLGMLFVGILMYVLMSFYGHYYIEGVGYAAIEDVLTGRLFQPQLLLLLFVLKLLATSLTLGSGASGGVFSPALFIGAMLGGAYGAAMGWLLPFIPGNLPAFAIAGMAGIVGGSTGAVMAAIVMIFEMTLDYNIILPLTITVAISDGMRWFLCRETIYTLKLVRRGHFMPEALQTNFHYLRRAGSIMTADPKVLSASIPLSDFARIVSTDSFASHFLVEDGGRIVGFVARDAALRVLEEAGSRLLLADVMERSFVTVMKNAPLHEILNRMRAGKTQLALVASQLPLYSTSDVLGLITKDQIVEAVEDAMDLFA
ncbi:chloride channel protein [Desulforhabdus sp. TSK]|uniref:chloride channel protein n=1 Tax=Desulforhabdus sp. TSK TaxID=2925014 RepID=UPI001FC83789|nr:chloride channel protein [Desulforhabdus sp. TSK]GKT09641.1 chloride channel protein [Desulforhabdus sp. TSK]